MSKVKWYWQNFSYASGKSRKDSRRAAFWLYDFINDFGIEDFRVVQIDGEWQNAMITIVYKMPDGLSEEKIDEAWSKSYQQWVESH